VTPGGASFCTYTRCGGWPGRGSYAPQRLAGGETYNLPRVFWPLIGGFIAFLIVLLFLGWILDRSEQRDPERQQH
jgi:hypothetical protein